MVEMPEQDYRSAEDHWSALGFGIQVVSSEYIVLQSQVNVELPGVGFSGLITGVEVRFPGVIVLEICRNIQVQ